MIQYEGGNGDGIDPTETAGIPMGQDYQYLEFWPYCFQAGGSGDAANFTTETGIWLSMGGVFPARFGDTGPLTLYGSFDCQYYDGTFGSEGGAMYTACVAANNRH